MVVAKSKIKAYTIDYYKWLLKYDTRLGAMIFFNMRIIELELRSDYDTF